MIRIIAILFGLSWALAAGAQVINFDVPGSAGAANFSGQGAYADPSHNYWNPVVGGGTTDATNLMSDGSTPTPITLTSQFGGTFGTQKTQGTPAALLQPYQYNNAIRRTNKLDHVPAGTYDLYLYSINDTGTRGTTFTVSTAAQPALTESTVNTPGSLTSFIPGACYVIFRNIIVPSAGAITFTWTGNPNVSLAGNNEGDFCGLQLVWVSSNTAPLNPPDPNFGGSVLLFDPSMPMSAIQSQLDAVFSAQQNSEFGINRYVYLFKSGQYSNLDLNVGYYTHVIGLGQNPDDVAITGNVHSDGALSEHNATTTFWKACENFSVLPVSTGASGLEQPNTMTWAVSQGTWLRRMHIKGNLNLANTNTMAWSSGGFLADSKIDSIVRAKTQQQWLSRNDAWQTWSGQNWNMVFVGVSNPPAGTWPGAKFTVVTNTPVIPEKPYLTMDSSGNFAVMVPSLRTNCMGITWDSGQTPGTSIPLNQFYLAQPALDNAGTINAALNAGLNLIFTPGVYRLTNTIVISRPGTIVLGLGYPTLIPTNGNVAISIADVDGVKVGGLIFDAGATASSELLRVGTTTSSLNHSADPICIYDIVSRVGGEFKGTTTNCITINANDVIGDNFWLWRADHGSGASWTGNPSNTGLEVNGDRVTLYGLFCEHHEKFQTMWNGNWGRVYFYQSELPYDAPSQDVWSHDGINGYASYKVADNVTSHQAYGLGVYGVFTKSMTTNYDVIEAPTNSQQVNLHDMIMVYITGLAGSEMTHIINGTGATLNAGVTTTTANSLWQNPLFNISALQTNNHFNITVPTESWHSYQLQYKNRLTDPTWSPLAGLLMGDDTLDLIATPLPSSNRFYRIQSQ